MNNNRLIRSRKTVLCASVGFILLTLLMVFLTKLAPVRAARMTTLRLLASSVHGDYIIEGKVPVVVEGERLMVTDDAFFDRWPALKGKFQVSPDRSLVFAGQSIHGLWSTNRHEKTLELWMEWGFCRTVVHFQDIPDSARPIPDAER
jgi:hypothetical protein